ncbi:MAG TPA: tryptophan--tRNA ligase [Planctomycetes bacterium]|nr:tryptophan--tRNA ligase [Planctomycetota bacterium]
MVRTLSGIQPTGNLHIGNYLGALVNWVKLQEQYDAYFCVVDLHALTQRPDPEVLRSAVRELAIGVLASGVDPERSTLFVQSQVRQHAELAWIMMCLTPLGDLNRMTQFKDKSTQQPENINAGLFTYPVLQTADIALYRPEAVPVGEDQDQHLELARETIRRFNFTYGGDVFPEPKTVKSQAPRVMGLDGESKMSKSKNNEIGLFETDEETMKKLRGAKTDPARERRTDKGTPEVCNIYSYHGFFSTKEQRDEVAEGCRSASLGCVDCKKLLAQNMEAVKGPIRERAADLRSKPGQVDEILAAGAAKARKTAEETMVMVRERIGIAGGKA